MVLMRMMLSGRRSSEMRIWFSWSYTDFLGTFTTSEKWKVRDIRKPVHFHKHNSKSAAWCDICEAITCAMSRESGEHSLSMLLVLSLWALEFCLSFMEVLRGRLCSLFSTLLRKEQNTRGSKYITGRKEPKQMDSEADKKLLRTHLFQEDTLRQIRSYITWVHTAYMMT